MTGCNSSNGYPYWIFMFNCNLTPTNNKKQNNMKLKAITYSYFQDGVLQNKVVGIFEKDELENALKDIRYFFKEQKVRLVNDKYEKL